MILRMALLAVCCTALATGTARADTPSPADAPPHTLFNPTPDGALRGLCTDRPTKSTGPCTVDAGHWQIELDAYDITWDRTDGVRTRTTVTANPTVKVGLTDSLDLEASYAARVEVTTTAGPATTRAASGGDLFLRLKSNLVGNTGGSLAVAISPFIKLPTAGRQIGNGAVEGGVVAPVQLTLGNGLQILVDPELDLLENASGRGSHLNLVNLISVSRALSSTVTLSAEVWSNVNFDPVKTVTQSSLDLGVAWIPHAAPSIQLDGGVNLGLNRSTPDVQVYAGVSRRF
jgi:hypothetical protein